MIDSCPRGTIARLWGLSIGIVSNSRVRAVATIAYCATDMLAKVYIDRYRGHQHNLKMTQQAIVRTIPFYRHRPILTG